MRPHVHVTLAKTSAECGHVPPDPRETLAELREQLGFAEGHLAALHGLLRRIEDDLEDVHDRGRAA